MRLHEIVDTSREGVHITAEYRILRLVPAFRALGYAVELHPAIEGQMRPAPILRRPSARFTIKKQEQIALGLCLRPSVRVEHRLAIGGEDMRRPIPVPENFRFTGGQAAGHE